MSRGGVLRTGCVAAVATLLTTGAVSTAFGQHAHNIEIGSTADGGGALAMDWDFDAQPIARVMDSGFPGLFSGDVPGFGDAADAAPDIYQLEVGTEVEIVVTAIDSGVSVKIGAVVLDSVGDTAVLGTTTPELHNHPEWQLLTADANTFGEGRVSFRVREGSTAIGYADSAIHTIHVSNGYLPVLEAATTADLKCQKGIAKAAAKLGAKVHSLLAKCLDKVQAAEHLGKSDEAAAKACDVDHLNPKSLASTVEAEAAKALSSASKACGALSGTSTPFTDSMVQAHLGMASCRAQEQAGAHYNGATHAIGHVLEHAGLGDEHDVHHALPCLKGSFE